MAQKKVRKSGQVSQYLLDLADPVKMYLSDLNKYSLLTPSEEIELGKRTAAGDAHAKCELVCGNLRLVVRRAIVYSRRVDSEKVGFLDLIQEGNHGLIRAVETWDYSRGYKFSTYGLWWINQAMVRLITHHGRTIRIPVAAGVNTLKVSKTYCRLQQELSRNPTDQEMAYELSWSLNKYQDFQRLTAKPACLDKTHFDLEYLLRTGEEKTAEAVVADTYLAETLNTMLKRLSKREEGIMRHRFGLSKDKTPKSLAELGRQLGVTRERVRQIETRAMDKLRSDPHIVQLRDYL